MRDLSLKFPAESTDDSLTLLVALNHPGAGRTAKHIYGGTVPAAVKARRRRRNKAARAARRASRSSR